MPRNGEGLSLEVEEDAMAATDPSRSSPGMYLGNEEAVAAEEDLGGGGGGEKKSPKKAQGGGGYRLQYKVSEPYE